MQQHELREKQRVVNRFLVHRLINAVILMFGELVHVHSKIIAWILLYEIMRALVVLNTTGEARSKEMSKYPNCSNTLSQCIPITDIWRENAGRKAVWDERIH